MVVPSSLSLVPPWTSSLCPPLPSSHKHGLQSEQTKHHLEPEQGPAHHSNGLKHGEKSYDLTIWPYKSSSSAYVWQTKKSYLQSHFLGLVIKTSLQETEGIESIQVAERTNKKTMAAKGLTYDLNQKATWSFKVFDDVAEEGK